MALSNKNRWIHFGFNVWYQYENVRDLKAQIASMHASNKKFLSKSNDGMQIDELVSSYIKTSLNSKAKTERKKHKQRFGVYFLIHLKKHNGMSLQVKILNEFIKQVCMGEENLPYFATTSRNGSQVYIHLWICDREFSEDKPKVYDRDYYYDEKGKTSGKDRPGAILKNKKGDIQYKKDGTPKMTGGWSQCKVRIFNKDLADNAVVWRDAFIAAFHCVMRNFKHGLKFALKKIPYDVEEGRYGWVYDDHGEKVYNKPPIREFIVVNREDVTWKKEKYRSIGQLQYFIKHIINELMINDFDNYALHEPDVGFYGHKTDIQNPPTAFGRELKKLFKNYDRIFNNWEFNHDGKTYGIMFERSDVVNINLQLLRDIFKSQIQEILNKFNREGSYNTM